MLGSEGSGLRPRVARACDELIALPLRGRIGSLNVSAAAAALLYEITRQRDGLNPAPAILLCTGLAAPLTGGP